MSTDNTTTMSKVKNELITIESLRVIDLPERRIIPAGRMGLPEDMAVAVILAVYAYNGGNWTVKSIKLRGFRVLKSGRPAATRWSPRVTYRGDPAWVQAEVERHLPTAHVEIVEKGVR